MALGVWIGLASAVGWATSVLLPQVAPSWDSTDHLASVISAEVYLALIVALALAFGGISGLRYRLRLAYRPAATVREQR